MHDESAFDSHDPPQMIDQVADVNGSPDGPSPDEWLSTRTALLSRVTEWVDGAGQTEAGRLQVSELLAAWEGRKMESEAGLPTTAESTASQTLRGLTHIVGELTALRHDMKSQAKNSRTLVEQVALNTEQIVAASERAVMHITTLQPSPDRETIRPLVMMVIEADEAISRLRDAFDHNVQNWRQAPPAPTKTWFGNNALGRNHEAWHTAWLEQHSVIVGLADGLRLTVDRMTSQLQACSITRIGCMGESFDPTTMQVLEVQPSAGHAVGTVLKVLRCGYRQHDWAIRPAQVVTAVKPSSPSNL